MPDENLEIEKKTPSLNSLLSKTFRTNYFDCLLRLSTLTKSRGNLGNSLHFQYQYYHSQVYMG